MTITKETVSNLELLKDKVRILQENHEKIGIETLKTKYEKAYNKLLDEIKTLTNSMISSYLSGIQVKQNCLADACSLWHMYHKQVKKSIYEDYDVEQAIEIMETYIGRIFLSYGACITMNIE